MAYEEEYRCKQLEGTDGGPTVLDLQAKLQLQKASKRAMIVKVVGNRVIQKDRERYLDAIRDQAEKVQTLEPRTRSYSLLQAKDDENTIFVVAVFEDEAAYKEHVNSPHCQGLLETIRSKDIKLESLGNWTLFNIVPDDVRWR